MGNKFFDDATMDDIANVEVQQEPSNEPTMDDIVPESTPKVEKPTMEDVAPSKPADPVDSLMEQIVKQSEAMEKLGDRKKHLEEQGERINKDIEYMKTRDKGVSYGL